MSDENQRSPDHHENRESLKNGPCEGRPHTDTHIPLFSSEMYVHTCSCMERIFGLIFEQPAHLQPHRRRRPPVLLGRWTVEG